MIAEGSVVLVNPTTGEPRSVKWFNRSHVQFYGGRSCSRRDIRLFYGQKAADLLSRFHRIFGPSGTNVMIRPGAQAMEQIHA